MEYRLNWHFWHFMPAYSAATNFCRELVSDHSRLTMAGGYPNGKILPKANCQIFLHSHMLEFCNSNFCQGKENGLCRAQSNLLFCCIHKLKHWRTDTCFWAQNRLSLLCTKMYYVKIFSSDVLKHKAKSIW